MRNLVAAVIALTASLLLAVPALAYTVGTGSTATASTSSPVGGTPFTATFTFKDASGGVLSGTAVTFSQLSGPANCTASFNPTSATTNASGIVTTSVTLPTGCPGAFVLRANLAGGGVLDLTVTEAGGLPNAATIPAQVPSWALMLLATGAFVVFAAVVGLARERRTRVVARS